MDGIMTKKHISIMNIKSEIEVGLFDFWLHFIILI